MTEVAQQQVSDQTAVRPFSVNIPEATLTVMRARIAATIWPDRETVDDTSQGVPLALMQDLSRYWATDYDWRKCEAKLNAFPQFLTQIDGLDIHFIHVKSKHENALPLIVTHGWPGSIIEQLKIIEPLTNPTAHGGTAADAFHIVIPSIPGYGFTEKPRVTGWDTARTARAWAVLMQRLGYTHYVAQGGDLGSVVTTLMAEQAPPGLLGIHTSSARNRSARHCENVDLRRSGSGRPNGRRKTCVRSNCKCYTASILPTPHSCGNGRRRCTASSIRRPVWRLGFWTMETATANRRLPSFPRYPDTRWMASAPAL